VNTTVQQMPLILSSCGAKEVDFKFTPAHLLVDCRMLVERGSGLELVKGARHGANPSYREWIQLHNQHQLCVLEDYILASIASVKGRRSGGLFPSADGVLAGVELKHGVYDDPFYITFFCAWGVHRSVSTKWIMVERLKVLWVSQHRGEVSGDHPTPEEEVSPTGAVGSPR
jgi:hypothetical protein